MLVQTVFVGREWEQEGREIILEAWICLQDDPKGEIRGTEVGETWYIRETENNLDVIYCEWEKCNQN